MPGIWGNHLVTTQTCFKSLNASIAPSFYLKSHLLPVTCMLPEEEVPMYGYRAGSSFPPQLLQPNQTARPRSGLRFFGMVQAKKMFWARLHNSIFRVCDHAMRTDSSILMTFRTWVFYTCDDIQSCDVFLRMAACRGDIDATIIMRSPTPSVFFRSHVFLDARSFAIMQPWWSSEQIFQLCGKAISRANNKPKVKEIKRVANQPETHTREWQFHRTVGTISINDVQGSCWHEDNRETRSKWYPATGLPNHITYTAGNLLPLHKYHVIVCKGNGGQWGAASHYSDVCDKNSNGSPNSHSCWLSQKKGRISYPLDNWHLRWFTLFRLMVMVL